MFDRLDGRTLHTFVAVLEEGSLSRAAEKLGYVQSTVTAHVRSLEEACGRPLFDRLPRGVEPTAAGRALARYAYEFLRLGASLAAELQSADRPRGVLRVRMLESFGVTRLAGVFPAYLQACPEVRLHLETGFYRDTVDEAAERRIDVGLVAQPPDRPELAFVPLVEEAMTFIASPELAARIRRDGWAGAAGERLVGFGRRCLYQTRADEALQAAGLGRADALEFASLEMIRQIVRTGLGLAFVPRSAVAHDLDGGTLAEVPPPQPVALEHGLVYHRHREPTAAARAFVRAVCEAFSRPSPV